MAEMFLIDKTFTVDKPYKTVINFKMYYKIR